MATAYLPQHRKTYSRWLITIGLTVTLGFCVICATVFNSMGRRDYEQARESAVNVINAVTSEIERTFELYDLSLQAVVDGVKLPNIWQLDTQTRDLLLFDRAATAKHLGALVVLDRNGRVILNSRDDNSENENKSESDYFKVHTTRTDVGLYVSPPSVTLRGEYVLYISRRITAADGSFNGVVAGSVGLSFFHDLFRKINLRNKDTLNLLMPTGSMVMRAPFDISFIGRDMRKSPTFQQTTWSSSGSFESTATIDSVMRVYVYKHTRGAPLIMLYGQSLDAIYAGWWSDALWVSLIIALLCASNIALIIWLARTLKKQTAAEYNLSLLSVIDNLTGLFNRRKFDEVLEQEWSRAQRAGYSIAALMIDADHFKAFNDTYGHQAGDVALKNLAGCIEKSALRSTDLCARYGGEEFVVILPVCDARQAEAFAERLREHVSSLRRAQLQGEITPTVSIGVAAVVPVQGMVSADLIEAADAALYQAKLKGRNCVVLASPPVAQADDIGMVA